MVMNKMKKNIYWICTVRNSISLICWTIIAVVFNKWWLAFFSILFWCWPEQNNKMIYFRVCDKCGKHSPETNTYNKALEKAKDFGWTHIKNGDKWEDYCPECSVEIK